jgi:hypothetical protein
MAERFATVVAYFGDGKPAPLVAAARAVAGIVADELGAAFQARPRHDVHATIIGLEAAGPLPPGRELETLSARLPANGSGRIGVVDYLVSTFDAEPLIVRFGFDDRDLGFTSRGRSPHERGVTVMADKVVLVGWPIDPAGNPMDRIDRVRRGAQRFGVTHRYHRDPGSTDPDVYLVLGELLGEPEPARLSGALDRARGCLAASPRRVELGTGQLRLVLYDNPRLPKATTTAIPLSTAAS